MKLHNMGQRNKNMLKFKGGSLRIRRGNWGWCHTRTRGYNFRGHIHTCESRRTRKKCRARPAPPPPAQCPRNTACKCPRRRAASSSGAPPRAPAFCRRRGRSRRSIGPSCSAWRACCLFREGAARV